MILPAYPVAAPGSRRVTTLGEKQVAEDPRCREHGFDDDPQENKSDEDVVVVDVPSDRFETRPTSTATFDATIHAIVVRSPTNTLASRTVSAKRRTSGNDECEDGDGERRDKKSESEGCRRPRNTPAWVVVQECVAARVQVYHWQNTSLDSVREPRQQNRKFDSLDWRGQVYHVGDGAHAEVRLP